MKKIWSGILTIIILLALIFSSQQPAGAQGGKKLRLDSLKIDYKILLPVGGLQDATLVYDDLSPSLVSWIQGAGGGGGGGYPPDGATIVLQIATPDTFIKVGMITGSNITNGSLTGADVQNGSLTATDLTGVIGDFTVPFPLTGGPIDIAAGVTTTDMGWDFDGMTDSLVFSGHLLDSLMPHVYDSVALIPTMSISGAWTFQAEGSVTFEEQPTISGDSFVLESEFGDLLKDNFGSLVDSVKKIRKDHLRAYTFVIDSSEIYNANKHFLMYMAQNFDIDTIFALWDPGVGANPSVEIMLRYGKNYGLTGTNIFEVPETVTSTSIGSKITTFWTDRVPNGNFIWVVFSSEADKLEQFVISIIGTED